MSNLNLEQQRKRAKDLRRAHRSGNLEAAVRIARHLPRARNHSPDQILGSTFILSEAQFVVAREAGFLSWSTLKHHIEEAQRSQEDSGERIVEAALVGDDVAVRAMLDREPAAVRSIGVSAAVADARTAISLLDAVPALANARSGARNWTPLLYLCCSRYRRTDPHLEQARLQIAKRLIELDADVNAAGLEPGYQAPNVNQMFDEFEWRPLDGAASRVASAALIRLLLEAGAELDQTNEIVSQTVRNGSMEVLQLLLQAGPAGWWQVAWALRACVILEKTEMARILLPFLTNRSRVNEGALLQAIQLQRGADLIEVLLGGDEHNELTRSVWRNAYRAALRYGHRPAVDALRRRGIDDSGLTDADRAIASSINNDRAALHRLLARSPGLVFREDDHRMLAWAVRTGHYRAVPLLLEAGLDPNVADKDSETPLHLAVRNHSIETIDALLGAGAHLEATNFDLETPLDVAVSGNEDRSAEPLIRRLLDAGARPAHERPLLDRDEMDLLFERAADAVASGDLGALRESIDEEPALVRVRSPRPHRATLLNYCGANGVEAPRQRTPPNAVAVMQLLLDSGADPNSICNLYGGGITTMGLLLTSCHPAKAGLRTALAETLLAAGATIGLGGAASIGRLDLVKEFLKTDDRMTANVKRSSLSAFMSACEFGQTRVVEFLLDQGADVKIQDENGQTGLHAAALAGHLDTAQLLIKRGAPLEVRNRWGGTVLNAVLWGAVENDPNIDYVPIVQALVNAGAVIEPNVVEWWRDSVPLVPSAKPRIAALLRRI